MIFNYLRTIWNDYKEEWIEFKRAHSLPPPLTCYLAGAMESLPDNGLQWRVAYQKLLSPLNIKCIIPNFREAEIIKDVSKLIGYKKENLGKYIEIMRQFIEKDLDFVRCVDFVIARWEGERTAGTIGEVQQAYLDEKPVYLVTSQPFHEVPGWFLACFTELFHTKQELIAFLRRRYER